MTEIKNFERSLKIENRKKKKRKITATLLKELEKYIRFF